ncbi:hypothetical protein HY249_02800, partial [Candidatus Azambacteria bacterium]|nr:hypothetical protein [Candidatus Azambacteria bacterium]
MIRSLFQKIFLSIKSSKFFSDTFIWRMVALGVFFDLLLLFYLKSKISHLGDIIDYASLLGSGYREMLENGA